MVQPTLYNFMGRRQKLWAKSARVALIKEMGGKCVYCGETHDLEIDHIRPRGWIPRQKSSDHRICIYRREWKAGLVQLLCSAHNSKKGHPELPF